jgi:hypothetical protein
VVNRRSFISAAAQGLLSVPLAGLAQQPARAPRIASPIAVNFPPGGQMYGAMIFPHHSKGLGAEQIEWNANFRLQHFTDRLDYLKAMGANCAKILGEVWYVHQRHVTLAQYCAQWDQVMTYAKSIGLYVYVCPFTPLTLWQVPLESVVSTVSGLIAHMEAQSYADYITCYDRRRRSGRSTTPVASTPRGPCACRGLDRQRTTIRSSRATCRIAISSTSIPTG